MKQMFHNAWKGERIRQWLISAAVSFSNR